MALDDIALTDLPKLAELGGLSHWAGSTRDDLSISKCPSLGSLEGLEGLSDLGRLKLSENATLASLGALDDIESIDDLEVKENPALSTAEAEALCARVVADSADCDIADNGP